MTTPPLNENQKVLEHNDSNNNKFALLKTETLTAINFQDININETSEDNDIFVKGTCSKSRIDASEKAIPDVKIYVYFVAIVAAFGGLLFGFDVGGTGGTFVMEGFRLQFGWPIEGTDPQWVSDQQGWIISIFTFGAMCGALMSGFLADWIGRKPFIMAIDVVCIIGVSIMASSQNIEMLYCGRFIGGYAIGSLSMVIPLFLSEMAPEHIRGVLVTLNQLCITFGVLLGALVNVGLRHIDWGWRLTYGGNLIFAVSMFILMVFLTESPRWLVQKGRIEEAELILFRIRQDYEVEEELKIMIRLDEEQKSMTKGKWIDLFKKKNNMSYRTMIGCAGQFFQQICGINAVMFFAPSIIATIFGPEEAIYANLGIQIANFLATFITIFSIEKVGRVTLLKIGGIGLVISTFLISILSSPLLDYQNNTTIGIFIVIFCTLYVIFFAFSWGPIVWVICSEIYPQNLRGKGMSLSTATNWAMTTIIGKVSPIMYRPENLDLWGTFLFFSAWCVFLSLFCFVFLPETAGVPLEKIDDLFENFKPGFRKKENNLNEKCLEEKI